LATQELYQNLLTHKLYSVVVERRFLAISNLNAAFKAQMQHKTQIETERIPPIL
jgi:hypothetical protein